MLKNLSPEHFLSEHWQKRPCFLPSAVNEPTPVLNANELAWLATQPDVESRLVFTDRTSGKTNYRVEHGPFTEFDLSELPSEDWTLLVQDVDKHLPDFRAWFDQVPFIPSWRIDDLMVSCAAPGGSVGPHKDNYDVFLCQGEGTRNWLVSDNRSVQIDASSTELSLLKPFDATEERLCKTGDVLYIPPGIPHWGVAEAFCVTYSIGMRAPTKAELVAGYSRLFTKDDDNASDGTVNGNDHFYTDANLQESESVDGRIAIESIRRIREQELLEESLTDKELMTILGSVVTDPKAWLDPDRATDKETDKILGGNHALHVHGMALITWCVTDEFRIVFANGSARNIPKPALSLVRELCVNRTAHAKAIQALANEPEGPDFIRWLLNQGVLDTG